MAITIATVLRKNVCTVRRLENDRQNSIECFEYGSAEKAGPITRSYRYANVGLGMTGEFLGDASAPMFAGCNQPPLMPMTSSVGELCSGTKQGRSDGVSKDRLTLFDLLRFPLCSGRSEYWFVFTLSCTNVAPASSTLHNETTRSARDSEKKMKRYTLHFSESITNSHR